MKALWLQDSRRSHGRGFSLLEIIVGISIFLLILSALLKVQVESNLPMQGMIRDAAMAMNLCERFINSLSADILAGEPPPVTKGEKDVTESVLEKGGNEHFWKAFVGVGKESTELTINFKAFLSIDDVGNKLGSDFGSGADKFFRLKIRCVWGKTSQHSYALQTMVYRR